MTRQLQVGDDKDVRLRHQRRSVDPAFIAIGIANLAPVVDRFCNDQNWRSGSLKYVADRVIETRTDPAVGFVVLQADEARHGITGGGIEPHPCGGLRRTSHHGQMRDQDEDGGETTHANDTNQPAERRASPRNE